MRPAHDPRSGSDPPPCSSCAEGLGQGSVLGVIPEALQPREVSGSRCAQPPAPPRAGRLSSLPQISGSTVGEIVVVPDMHTRKASSGMRAGPAQT